MAPKGGHRGMLMLAASAGGALVKVTGLKDATYTPGSTEADAYGMDAAHGFKVRTMAMPSITFSRVEDFAQSVVWQAMEATEAGEVLAFAFYPIGESPYSDTTKYLTGTCLVNTDHKQSLTDPVNAEIVVSPADDDWVRVGHWT